MIDGQEGALWKRMRHRTHLDVEVMARLVEMSSARLAAIESGAPPEVDEVQRFARVFGVRPGDLTRGVVGPAPLPMLLRSAYDDGREALQALIDTRAIDTLGAFQQRVLDVAELEAKLGRQRNALPETFGFRDPERLARTFRLRWGLGLEPVPSMRALLERLDVAVFYVGGTTLTGEIDGACTDWPRPAILVNLTLPTAWWRTRMTLAHELAHLLFHMAEQRTIYSPRSSRGDGRRSPGRRWESFEGFDAVEAQANAFAACLLAPAESVCAAVASLDPSSEEAIARVGAVFGVGRIVAINRLQIVFGLSDAERQSMEARADKARWTAGFADDVVLDEEVGFDQGPVPVLVAEALSKGAIGTVRAHELLGLGLDTTPQGLPPLWTQLESLRIAAQRYLASHHPAAECVVEGIAPEGDGWRVAVVRGEAGTRIPTACGTLHLDARGAVVQDAVQLPAR